VGLGFLRPFAARRDGTIAVRLSGTERQVLAHTLAELRELLLGPGDPTLARLTPTARPDDAEAEADWQRWMHDELLQSRLTSLDTVERTLDAETMSPDELGALLQSCNALRLVLAARLGIEDEDDQLDVEPDDPDAPAWAVYDWLALVIDSGVRVLAGQIHDDGPERPGPE
jgi:hypothetical protein